MAYRSVLTAMNYHVRTSHPDINPLAHVQFLADIAAFLGPWALVCWADPIRFSMGWVYLNSDRDLNPEVPYVPFDIILPHKVALTTATSWHWTRKNRRVTNVSVRAVGEGGVYLGQPLPKSCATIDDALVWLEDQGVTPDPAQPSYAFVPDTWPSRTRRGKTGWP